jgi:hypothetical protein
MVCNAQGQYIPSSFCGQGNCCREGPVPGTAFCVCGKNGNNANADSIDSEKPTDIARREEPQTEEDEEPQPDAEAYSYSDESTGLDGQSASTQSERSACKHVGAWHCHGGRYVVKCHADKHWHRHADCGNKWCARIPSNIFAEAKCIAKCKPGKHGCVKEKIYFCSPEKIWHHHGGCRDKKCVINKKGFPECHAWKKRAEEDALIGDGTVSDAVDTVDTRDISKKPKPKCKPKTQACGGRYIYECWKEDRKWHLDGDCGNNMCAMKKGKPVCLPWPKKSFLDDSLDDSAVTDATIYKRLEHAPRCKPGKQACEGRWIYECWRKDRKWHVDGDCGNNMCVLRKNKPVCLPWPKKGSIDGSSDAGEEHAPVPVSQEEKGGVIARATQAKPGAWCPTSGRYACVDNRSSIVVCGPDNTWRLSANCGGKGCCKGGKGKGTPFCYCSAEADVLLSDSQEGGVTARHEPESEGNCWPGEQRCSIDRKAVWTCDATRNWKMRTPCGKLCCQKFADGSAKCIKCVKHDSGSLDSLVGAPEDVDAVTAKRAEDCTPEEELQKELDRQKEEAERKRPSAESVVPEQPCTIPGGWMCGSNGKNDFVAVCGLEDSKWYELTACGGLGCCKSEHWSKAYCTC